VGTCREISATPRSRLSFTLEAAHAYSSLPVAPPHSAPWAAKSHSIPRGSFRLRSMNSIRSPPARPFRCTTPFFRRSTPD